MTNYLELLPGKHVGPAIVLLLLIHLFVCLFFGKLETNLATERIVRGLLLLKKRFHINSSSVMLQEITEVFSFVIEY